MRIDTKNAVVQLCLKGMEAEAAGKRNTALDLYMRAWNGRIDGFEGCIAAHYIAKFQETPEVVYTWNKRALDEALSVTNERVRDFYPSLYLNLGKSCEDMERVEEAKKYYIHAKNTVDILPNDGLGAMIRQGIERGLKRVGG